MVRKSIILALIITLVCGLSSHGWNVSTAQAQVKFHVSAQAAILMDVESGRILYEKNIDSKLRIASITKIMTAILALEHGVLDEKIKVSKNAYGVEGSSIYLQLGETLSLEDLLYGLMLRSGNDAAVAIAEHIGGSVEGFSFLMNQKAAELGMTNSMFSNPHGLDTHEDHYSTARDMALLTSYALKNDHFAQIVKTKRMTPNREKIGGAWGNKNRLLNKYPHADGVKTGFTRRAGRTLVSSATKEDHQLVAVTLNAPDDWNDHIRLFEYGFQSYKQIQLGKRGEKIEHQRLNSFEGNFQLMNHFSYPLQHDERVKKKIVLHPDYAKETLETIPYPAGFLHYYIDEQEIGRVAIQYSVELHRPSFWQRVKSLFFTMTGQV